MMLPFQQPRHLPDRELHKRIATASDLFLNFKVDEYEITVNVGYRLVQREFIVVEVTPGAKDPSLMVEGHFETQTAVHHSTQAFGCCGTGVVTYDLKIDVAGSFRSGGSHHVGLNRTSLTG